MATFSLSFKFKSPEGIDESKFDPKEQETAAVVATWPVLSCQQYEVDTLVAANTDFNMTVKIIDRASKVEIDDLMAAVGAVSLIWSVYCRILEGRNKKSIFSLLKSFWLYTLRY